MKPLLVVTAHPDDEAFGPAGTIAYFATQRDVYLICATHGDANPAFTTHTGNDLGEIRKVELETSANILGVKKVFFLGYKDGSLSNNLYHKLASDIQKIIDEVKPDEMMTLDMRGVSGHLDHVAVSMISSFVFRQNEFMKKLYYYVIPEERRKQHADFYDNYFVFFPPGYKSQEIDWEVDVEKYWETRVKAMQAHTSQKEDSERIINMLKDFPKREYFQVWKK